MIVIDIGCGAYGGDYSTQRLLDEFEPTQLYAFDPMTPPYEGPDWDTRVIYYREAVWTYDGMVGFRHGGLGGWVDENCGRVPCRDLARFILELDDQALVLKMDAEKSEYELLPWLMRHDADKRVTVPLIEWHCRECGYGVGRHSPKCTGDLYGPQMRTRIEEAWQGGMFQEWRW